MSLKFADEDTVQAQSGLPLEWSDPQESLKITGFWMFLVTDILIFASLFSSYAVYRSRIASGPTPAQAFHMGPVLVETLLLLTSSFTVGLAIWSMRSGRLRAVYVWTLATLLLGAGFVFSEFSDFSGLIALGHTWHQSAFLSAFFILVGTHGAHVSFGIFWALGILSQVARGGLTPVTTRKLYVFSLYWHFLDIVWVFIFTFVYLGSRITVH